MGKTMNAHAIAKANHFSHGGTDATWKRRSMLLSVRDVFGGFESKYLKKLNATGDEGSVVEYLKKTPSIETFLQATKETSMYNTVEEDMKEGLELSSMHNIRYATFHGLPHERLREIKSTIERIRKQRQDANNPNRILLNKLLYGK